MDINKLIESYEDTMVEKLCEIVSIPSVEGTPQKDMPFGKEVDRALKYTLKLSEEIGLTPLNVDNYAGHADYGDGDEILGVILHLDVVPAGNDWTVKPFEPKLVDGKIYGRGTTDNKGPLISVLYAIKGIIDSGIVPKKKIRVIYGTNEETRWEGINYYLERFDSPDFTIVPDAVFPMIYAEKGIADIVYKTRISNNLLEVKEFTGGNALNSVPDFARIKITSKEKVILDLKKKLDDFPTPKKFSLSLIAEKSTIEISVKGVPAHGSVPEDGANAISFLANVLTGVLPSETNLYKVVSFIDSYMPFDDYNGNKLGIYFEDEPSGKLTCNLGTLKMEGDNIEMAINIRYPVTMDYDMMLSNLKLLCIENDIELSEYDHLKPIYQPLDSPTAKTLLNAYEEITGDKESKPISIGAGTYARAMKNAIAYGGQMQSDEVVPHQNDEYITSESLVMMAKVYAKAIYDLACK
ncbi:dipeptidase PepV [Wukongibacter baidiensis]|uniref:dipeptidase PepV n=1 Tax=Wukongibacter baidiensis TaxID=1723361 RepID=UPI003D7F675F